ncbi:MAG: dihydroorotate dehydrogenase electron transfer subunit [Actinobacteria bacterium]|uniref:Unannotated protein n=1 Tax=freshwater metagenome TaxID=449393 RepID=A0A6J6A355_9ZZZZ|nr:dihydroorotate dehydrogenase electron transfer subunit [Actinomycetota bacterium]
MLASARLRPELPDPADRVQAPLGTRELIVSAAATFGPYSSFTLADPDGPVPAAGQFYMLSCSDGWGGGVDQRPYLPRAISVYKATSGEISFLLEGVGPGTDRLEAAQVGDRITVLGPLGIGFEVDGGEGPNVLCAGGIGIAPIAMLQESLISAGSPQVVVLGFRDAAHAAGATLFAEPRVATDNGELGHHGLVTELLLEEIADSQEATIFGCGPPAMLEALRAISVEAGVTGQLALEAPMACGYGACYGCVVKNSEGAYQRTCVDGPVIAASELAVDWHRPEPDQ